MHFLPSLLLHFLASLPITTTAASPIDPFAPQAEEGLQRILREADNPHQRPGPPQKSNHHFDAAPNSVGLLLTTASGTKGAQEVVHVWLPLGRRVEIPRTARKPTDINAPLGDAPTLPSHPKSARITTLIHSLPELATPERLGEVECEVFLRVNETRVEEGNWEAGWGERRMGRKPRKDVLRSVTFGRRDGLVRLADPGGGFWIGGGGGEVEAYECR